MEKGKDDQGSETKGTSTMAVNGDGLAAVAF